MCDWLDDLASAVEALDAILDNSDTTLLELLFWKHGGFPLLAPVYLVGKIWLRLNKKERK
jgi:hypothetical protein